MPAMCVPCPYWSAPLPRALVKSTFTTTRPASAGWFDIPLSITATPTPRPLAAPIAATWPAHTASAPVVLVVNAMWEWTMASPERASTSLSFERAASASGDAVNTAPEVSTFLTRRP